MTATDTTNHAGGRAYKASAKHALAQFAVTGCLRDGFYLSAEGQQRTALSLARECSPDFVARVALYARRRGHMKELPALLCAELVAQSAGYLEEAFEHVIDNATMLRKFVGHLRSGVTGRKSLGTRARRLVRRWLEQRSDDELFRASVGNNPSLADVLALAHPHPSTDARAALYGYLCKRSYNAEALPALVKQYELYKQSNGLAELPDLPFLMLTSLDLGRTSWCRIAERMGWHALRSNLNTLARHGVFGRSDHRVTFADIAPAWMKALQIHSRYDRRFDAERMIEMVVGKLTNPDTIARAKVLPHQLFAAGRAVSPRVPREIVSAIETAMEHALSNVPALPEHTVLCVDVSGSMSSAVTGSRSGVESSIRCVDVAALFAASILRKTPSARVLPFDSQVHHFDHWQQPLFTVANALATLGGGGTDCAVPLHLLNETKHCGKLVVYFSDNESWIDRNRSGQSGMLREWELYRERNPTAKLVCVDLTPNVSTQVPEREDVLHLGGFSDAIFETLQQFVAGGNPLNFPEWIEQFPLPLAS